MLRAELTKMFLCLKKFNERALSRIFALSVMQVPPVELKPEADAENLKARLNRFGKTSNNLFSSFVYREKKSAAHDSPDTTTSIPRSAPLFGSFVFFSRILNPRDLTQPSQGSVYCLVHGAGTLGPNAYVKEEEMKTVSVFIFFLF